MRSCLMSKNISSTYEYCRNIVTAVQYLYILNAEYYNIMKQRLKTCSVSEYLFTRGPRADVIHRIFNLFINMPNLSTYVCTKFYLVVICYIYIKKNLSIIMDEYVEIK